MQATSGMHHVYIIRSQSSSERCYIGVTADIDERLAQHNQGRSPHTSKYRPWHLETLICFDALAKAVAFDRYLKSGSGFAFAKKHV